MVEWQQTDHETFRIFQPDQIVGNSQIAVGSAWVRRFAAKLQLPYVLLNGAFTAGYHQRRQRVTGRVPIRWPATREVRVASRRRSRDETGAARLAPQGNAAPLPGWLQADRTA